MGSFPFDGGTPRLDLQIFRPRVAAANAGSIESASAKSLLSGLFNL
jgi:hypothetical protein